jgi:hypothetical protein
VTTAVDLIRNVVESMEPTMPKWTWNVLALGLGIGVALSWKINPFDNWGEHGEIQGFSVQFFTGLAMGGASSGWHELFDALSGAAKSAKAAALGRNTAALSTRAPPPKKSSPPGRRWRSRRRSKLRRLRPRRPPPTSGNDGACHREAARTMGICPVDAPPAKPTPGLAMLIVAVTCSVLFGASAAAAAPQYSTVLLRVQVGWDPGLPHHPPITRRLVWIRDSKEDRTCPPAAVSSQNSHSRVYGCPWKIKAGTTLTLSPGAQFNYEFETFSWKGCDNQSAKVGKPCKVKITNYSRTVSGDFTVDPNLAASKLQLG